MAVRGRATSASVSAMGAVRMVAAGSPLQKQAGILLDRTGPFLLFVKAVRSEGILPAGLHKQESGIIIQQSLPPPPEDPVWVIGVRLIVARMVGTTHGHRPQCLSVLEGGYGKSCVE